MKATNAARAWRTWAASLLGAAGAIALGVTLAPGCIFALTQTSVGQGTGCVTGALSVPTCWSGQFNLQPDFFAGVPYMNTFDIRIQHGSDFESFSDGLAILVDDIDAILPGPDGGLYGQPLAVSIPAGVTVPGVPLKANPDPAPVHVVLYLQHTCQVQDVALYALDQVSLNADGTCNGLTPNFTCGAVLPDAQSDSTAPGDAMQPQADAGGTDGGAGSATIGHSTITFTSIFDGNVEATSATQRLTEATFDLYLADPRNVAPGGLGAPPQCQGHLQGSFRFYFQRGQPAQPFP